VTDLNNQTESLADGQRSPTRELLVLAAPIIGMTLSRMLMGFIDFVMVSQLGTLAQAAISPATIIVFAIACPGMGVANGVQTFVSQADGRGEPRECGAYGWQTLYIALLGALLAWPLAETTSVWYGWITALAEREPGMEALEIEYARIAVWSVPLAVVSIGLNGFFMGIQRTRVVLVAVIASLVVNATGNYLLIFGKLGFPQMGIAGAAVATVIGWGVRAGILVVAMLNREIDGRYNTRRAFGLKARKMRQLIYEGGPTSIQWLVDIGSWVVFLAIIMPPYGTYAAAASNVGLQYMHLSFMPALGIGLALCSQVGFAIGEGKHDKAVAQTRVAMRLTGGYMGTIGLLFVVCGYPLMWLMSDDPKVINAGVLVLIGAAIFQVFDAMCITYMNALRGAGDTRWPAVVVFVCCWVIFVGGGVAVGRVLPQAGLLGPWAMCAVYIVVLGLLLRRRWRVGPWRRIQLFKAPADAAEAGLEGLGPSQATASD
jgi:MATE family multidrug resistance protein